MNRILKQNNRGIASVFGTVFILFLVIFLASTLFVSLYSYEENAQESIDIEQERVQEKIVLLSLSTNNVSGTEYLNSLLINNTGTIITRIRAIYIDNIFICDPTDSSLNPYDTYINPKDYLNVQLPNNLLYEPLSKIEVATERGIKSVEYEWMLRGGNQTDSPSEIQKIYFGPLLLDFDKFYYTKYEDLSDPNSWKPGWSVENSLEVVWNITVTNIDDRNLTINEYSGFTIVPNAEGAQKPWFIEPPNGQDTIFIPSNTTVSLIYIWDGPQSGATQSVYNQNQECRIFMSFFGIFHEKDGSTKPYGQTIPFEAVLLRDPQIEIVADPTVIAAGSSMTSIITVTVLDVMGLIADNVQVNFTTTLGNIPPVTITDSNGVATVTLSPGLTPGTAIITATAENAEKSTSVEIVPGTLTIEADPSTLAANSTTTSEITARVILNGSPLAGETVTFTNENPELGELLSPTTVTTDGQGYATVTFDPGTDIGTATITAEWGILPPLPISVEIVPGTLTIEADPSTLAANSTTTSEITARVILNGSPLAGETVTFTNENPELGELLSPTTVTTDGQGYATVTFDPGTDIGTATITAEWGILPPLPISVEIVPGTLTIEADPSTLAANSTTTSEITARVILNGSPLAGETVTFTNENPELGELLSPTTVTTDGQGYATVTFDPGTDIGTATITAEWGILPPLPVSVDISSGEMSLDADPLTITANPIVISQITAYVTLNGSPLGGETVTFTNQRPDLGYLDSTTVITNATGHANVTFTPTSIGTTTVIAEWGTLIRLIAVEIV